MEQKKQSYCDKLPTLIVFAASWCGHCQNLKPIIEEMEQSQRINYHIVRFEETDQSQISHFNKFDIKGFPTLVVYVPNLNTSFYFKGDRDKKTILAFVRKVSNLSANEISKSGIEYKIISVDTINHGDQCAKIN